MAENIKINFAKVRESIYNGSPEECKNGMNLIISVLRWKCQVDKELQPILRDCVSGVIKKVISDKIDNSGYPIVDFFTTITNNDMCFLHEEELSSLLGEMNQSDIDSEGRSRIKIVHIIAFNQPSALVSHRNELRNVLSGILDNDVNRQEIELGLEIVAKLPSFDESFMNLAIGLFTEAIETEPHSHPTRWTIRGVAIYCLFVNHMEPEPEPWPVCFKLYPVLSKIPEDNLQVSGRAKELLDYFLENYENAND